MCKLVPFITSTGNTIMVAEHKKDMLNKYLELFPKYSCIKKVFLFGSTLTERCNEKSDIDLYVVYEGIRRSFYEALDGMLEDCFDVILDDILGCDVNKFAEINTHGLLTVVKQKGVLIYDSKC